MFKLEKINRMPKFSIVVSFHKLIHFFYKKLKSKISKIKRRDFFLNLILSGTIILSFFAFFKTLFIFILYFNFRYFQINNYLSYSSHWRDIPIGMEDLFIFSIFFLIIATVSWLLSREIERFLNQSKKSERDNLEFKIAERTKELKEFQMEKITQLYRFAEFGKLSAGLFHDLVNPLTALSLNLGKVEDKASEEIKNAKSFLGSAIKTTKRMENFVMAIQKQIIKQKTLDNFSLNEEISQCIQIFSYKANKANIKIIFNPIANIKIYGDAIKFSQVVTNLISNAIDSFENVKREIENKKIKIYLKKTNGFIYLNIKDNGSGIKENYLEKIWEPFFTTKDSEKGTGIGLSTAKDFVNNDFKGKIKLKTELNLGSEFKIKLPISKLKI